MTDMSSRIGPHLIAVLHGGAVAALTGCGSGSETANGDFAQRFDSGYWGTRVPRYLGTRVPRYLGTLVLGYWGLESLSELGIRPEANTSHRKCGLDE